MKATDDLPPCLIFIDKEGRWFHRGVEMIHRRFIRLYYQHIEESKGAYFLPLNGKKYMIRRRDE